jgi:hypothetical protein
MFVAAKSGDLRVCRTTAHSVSQLSPQHEQQRRAFIPGAPHHFGR